MSTKLSVSPSTTAELVSLLRYLYRCTDNVMKDLKKKIAEASQRLGFLMDYALLPREHHIYYSDKFETLTSPFRVS